MLEGGFAGFRFGGISRFFVIGRIAFIRRCGSMEGACLADGRSILADLEREAVEYDGCGSDAVRLDDADSRIFGMIDIT